MMNPNEFEYQHNPSSVFSVKQQYKRLYRDKKEIIYKVLRIIEAEEGITAFNLRTESHLGIGYYPLQELLKMLTNASLITNDGRNYKTRKVTCYKITDKGRMLIQKYDVLFSMLPAVWRTI